MHKFYSNDCYGLIINALTSPFSVKKLHWICSGIVGAGIGGTSTAYFLHQTYPDVEIEIFEPSHICGRVSTIKLQNDRHYESGGSIIHPRNMVAAKLVDTFGE